jgi:NAD(P)-dependent dehydrogenase (short-subunit alcohol dehydrogenase family)
MAKTKWEATDIPDQTGKTFVITGANSGLGFRSSEALAARGARVIMACRNAEKAAAALEAVKAKATGAPPEVVSLDLADLSSVRACAKQLDAELDHIDVLMNNAGVMALPLRRTAEGFEMQFGTNHLGHFALTGLVLPTLLKAEAPRVVTTSSQAHRPGRINFDDLNWNKRRYSKWLAYSQTKLANLLFMYELQRRSDSAAGGHLLSLAAHPGYAATHLQAAGPEMTGKRLGARLFATGNRLLAQSDAAGALPQLYASTLPGLSGGTYYGPDGIFEQKGWPEEVKSKRAARSEETAARLWRVSEELTGVTYDWPSK